MRNWVGYLSWFFILAIVCVEIASASFLKINANDPPGIGIRAIALLDGFIFYAWSIKTFSPMLNPGIQIPLVKISDFIVALFLLITCIIVILSAIAFTILLISLLLAIPFGTIVYMAAFADFKVGSAQATLGVLMSLKIAFAISIVIAEKDLFKYYRSLIIVLLCSFLCNIIVSILHTFPPSFLVSITDAIAAIVVTIIAFVWILISFIPSIIGVISLILDAIGGATRVVDP